MADTKWSTQSLKYGWASLWRAHTSLPREMTSEEFTIFVRAIDREQAHAAMGRVIHAMFPTADLEYAYYNLTSAHELVEQGASPLANDRLFETGWQGDRAVAWVDKPVFAVPDAAELFRAWMESKSSRYSEVSESEASELDRPLFIAAALRGLRLQRMPNGYYGLYKRNGQTVDLVGEELTFKDVANRCGAVGKTTLRVAVERDGLVWPDTYEAFLALVRSV